MAAGDGASEGDHADALGIQAGGAGFAQHRVEVELEVLRVVGQRVAQILQSHVHLHGPNKAVAGKDPATEVPRIRGGSGSRGGASLARDEAKRLRRTTA